MNSVGAMDAQQLENQMVSNQVSKQAARDPDLKGLHGYVKLKKVVYGIQGDVQGDSFKQMAFQMFPTLLTITVMNMGHIL